MKPGRIYFSAFTFFNAALALFCLFAPIGTFLTIVGVLCYLAATATGAIRLGVLETEFVRKYIGDRTFNIPEFSGSTYMSGAVGCGIVTLVLFFTSLFGDNGVFDELFYFVLSVVGAYLTFASVMIARTIYQNERDAAPSAG